jgi:lipopolysaccharide transport system permease protein
LPFSIYILRLLTRNFIVLLHNFLPVLPILIYYKIAPTAEGAVYLIFGLMLFLSIGYSFGLLLAILGSRFRDMKPIVASLVQISFLITPILWQHSMLSSKLQMLMNFNPFYQLIQLLRAPLLGQIPPTNTLIYCIALALSGFILMVIILARCRHRIAFWV